MRCPLGSRDKRGLTVAVIICFLKKIAANFFIIFEVVF